MTQTQLLRYLYHNALPPIVPKVIRRLKLRWAPGMIHPPFDALPGDFPINQVLDVGANEGVVAAAALKSYSSAKVVCFEPVPVTFKTLERNLASYGDRKVLFNLALSDRAGSATIHLNAHHGANSLEEHATFHQHFNPHIRESGVAEISLVRLDDIADQLPAGRYEVMKIDVEGHELKVIEGGQAFIRDRVDSLIVEVAFMRDQSWNEQGFLRISAKLETLGFRLINIYDINRAERSDMMIVQFDCVFKRVSSLRLSY